MKQLALSCKFVEKSNVTPFHDFVIHLSANSIYTVARRRKLHCYVVVA